jgi:hypothetical protein
MGSEICNDRKRGGYRNVRRVVDMSAWLLREVEKMFTGGLS